MTLFRSGRLRSSARLRALHALYRAFKERNAPEFRARCLLREWLSTDQREQFDARGYFEVTGSLTGRRYRICQGTMSNVLELDEEGEPTLGWCFVPERALATGDVMLAQKIALETDEPAVLALANAFSPKLPSLPRVLRRPN